MKQSAEMSRSSFLSVGQVCRIATVIAVLAILLAGAGRANFKEVGTARAATEQLYNLTSLGQLYGSGADAASMNSKGEIVGGTGPYCGVCGYFGPASEAWVWRSGTLIDLGQGAASGINRHEEIVGESYDATSGESITAVWKHDKPFKDAKLARGLKRLGGPASGAASVTDAGVIVGGSQVKVQSKNNDECNGYVCHAFSYNQTASPRMTDLGPPGVLSGGASAVNSANEVVGQANGPKTVSWVGGLQLFAVAWQHGQMKVLPAPAQTLAFADAINATGEIAGGVSLTKPDPSDALCPQVAPTITPLDYASEWINGKLTLLPPSGTFPDSVAYAINDKGVVGGSLHNACELQDAAIWNKGSVLDLTKVTPSLRGGTQLRYVVAVGNNGDIVATAADEQKRQVQSYLLTPCSSNCTTKIAQTAVAYGAKTERSARSSGGGQDLSPKSQWSIWRLHR